MYSLMPCASLGIYYLAIGMSVTIFSQEMCSCVCVCYSLVKCYCKIKENEEDEDAVSFYMKVFNGSME